jgi:hypothetical protein
VTINGGAHAFAISSRNNIVINGFYRQRNDVVWNLRHRREQHRCFQKYRFPRRAAGLRVRRDWNLPERCRWRNCRWQHHPRQLCSWHRPGRNHHGRHGARKYVISQRVSIPAECQRNR